MGLILNGLMTSGLFPGFDAFITSDSYIFGANNTLGFVNSNVFTPVGSPLTGGTIIDGTFSSTYIGYGVSRNGEVIKTINGGNSWSQKENLSATFGGFTFRTIYTTSDDVVFVGGKTSGGTMAIFKSSDGGDSFSLVYNHLSVFSPVESFSFINDADGFAITVGRLTKTTDSGNTWSTAAGITGTTTPSYDEVGMVSSTVGYIADEFASKIYKTVDGGFSATPITTLGGSLGLHAITETNTWACGSGGYVHNTTNGTSFNSTVVGLSGTGLQCIHFNSGVTAGAVCGGAGQIYTTVDTGSTWTQVSGTTSGTVLHAVHVF